MTLITLDDADMELLGRCGVVGDRIRRYLRAQDETIKALLEDAERLDWVERKNPIIFHKTSDQAEWGVVVSPHEEKDEYFAATFRATIDAARLAHS